MNATVKVEHINPFLGATIETMRAMVKTEVQPGKVTLMRGERIRFDISGVIGLSGGAKGSVAICFPRITAVKILSAFAQIKILALDSDAVDATGELANIIAGAAKKHLEKYNINISLPSVVLGEDHSITGPSDITPLMVPFSSPHGPFVLIVRFKSES